jgi:hypothetical protein
MLDASCAGRAALLARDCELHANAQYSDTLTWSYRAVGSRCRKGEEEVKAADYFEEVKLTLTDSESVPRHSHVPVFSGRVK